MSLSGPHLWVALSPHGFGHGAMTSPVVAGLRRRFPSLRLTLQTSLPHDFLVSRYGTFRHVDRLADFGLRMHSATRVNMEASAAAYRDLHARLDREVEAEARLMAADPPDLVLGNVPYVALAAAHRAGIPAVAMSSLNWADVYAYYFRDRPEAPEILAQMHRAYGCARMFLRSTPAMPMTVAHQREIGALGTVLPSRGDAVHAALGLKASERIGLIAFGGMDLPLPLDRWPRLEGWTWLTTLETAGVDRHDIRFWQEAGLPFAQLIPSVEVLIGKVGYGTFVDVAVAGTPMLFLQRPGWPESPHFDHWLPRYTRCLGVATAQELMADLPDLLHTLFSQSPERLRLELGVEQTVDLLAPYLDTSIAVGRVG